MTVDHSFVSEIKGILAKARQHAYQAVNSAMVEAYWLMSKRIVDEEQKGETKASYGEALLKNLSIALTEEFGQGFSYANLRNFRQFYLTYPDSEICYTVCSKLTWSHNRLIMRVESEAARKYYLEESAAQNWSVRTLERNINTFYYQRTLSTQVQAEKTTEAIVIQDFIKDPYVFEFLNLKQLSENSESDLEQSLIQNVQQFLLELDKGFSFVARQQRISSETDHFYVDLVFYNYFLKCFVLIDLKTNKLTHQDIGQMDMYRRMYDDLKRPEGDNPTIGIILCTEKSETVVKYSVINDNSQLFAAKYLPYLPSEKELKEQIELQRKLIEEKMKVAKS